MRTISYTDDLGFLLAKALQRFNERLTRRLSERGFADVRPSFGSVLVPLFAEDGLRAGELAARSRMSKQAITGLVRLCEQAGLVARTRDLDDGRAYRVSLTERGMELREVAGDVLAEIADEIAGDLGNHNYQALVRGLKGVMDL